MVETVIHTVGRDGDFATLAAWAASLPADIAALDRAYVAELAAGREDPGGAVIRTRCEGESMVTVRAAPGQGFTDLTDPIGDPLVPAVGFGATVRATSGPAIVIAGAGTAVRLQGLQIVAEDGPAVSDDGRGACVSLKGCLIEAASAEPAATIRGSAAVLAASVILQRGSGDGACLADGANAEGCTIFKPARLLADGLGISIEGEGAPEVRSTVAFGFRQAFGAGIGSAAGLVSDQANALPSPERFDHPSWTPANLIVDASDTRPGPFGAPLQRLAGTDDADASIAGPGIGSIPPGGRVAMSVIVAEPTAVVSAIALVSPAGQAEVRVRWAETPPETALLSRPHALAAVAGGLVELGGGLWRLWLTAENRTGAGLDVHPVLHVARGIENAGLSAGLYAGAVMAAPGHIGTGFCQPDSLPGSRGLTAVDPEQALVSTSRVLPDLRPLEGGALDGAGLLGSRDVLGRGRLVPDTAGALTLNPAPRFLGAFEGPPSRRRRIPTPARAARPGSSELSNRGGGTP